MKTPVVLQRFAPRASEVSSTGRTVNCADAAAVQAALDSAQPGDNIVLQAGQTYAWDYAPGTQRHIMFTCRNVAGAGDTPGSWITIRTSSDDSVLPPQKRVQPLDAPKLAKILLPNPTWYSVHFDMEWGAHHYRFVGLDLTIGYPLDVTNFAGTDGGMWGCLFLAPSGFANYQGPSAVCHHIVVDRCYIHVADTQLMRTPIRPEGDFMTVENCWIGEAKQLGDEAQCIGWGMANGPYRFVNNYFGGGTEGIMPGGGDVNANYNYPNPPDPGFIDSFPMTMSDLFCAGNWFIKDWEHTYAASPNLIPLGTVPPNLTTYPVIKNNYEYKWLNRAICEANIIEYNFPQGQEGSQTLFTVRAGYTINIYGNGIGSGVGPHGEDWIMVDNCWYHNNIFAHTLQGINFLGCDDGSRFRGHQSKNCVVENNFFYDISGDSMFWNAGRGQAPDYKNTFANFMGVANAKFIRNTVLDTGGIGWISSLPYGFVQDWPPAPGSGFAQNWQSQRPEGALCTGLEYRENIICYVGCSFAADSIGTNSTGRALSIQSPNAKVLNNGFITPNPQYMQDAVGDGLVHPNYDGSVMSVMPATWVISGSKFAMDIASAGFVNADPLWVPGNHRNLEDYALTPSSPFYTASATGGPIGADIAAIQAATMGCITGDWGAQGPPEPLPLGTATISTIVPDSGMQGETLQVVITGSGLLGGEVVPVPGIEATVIDNSNDSAILVEFKIRHRTRPATWAINVSCDNGPTNGVPFTITQAPAPVVTSLSVNQGSQYSEIEVVATGQNLKWAEITNATGGFVNQPIIPYTVIKHAQFPNASDTMAVFTFTIKGPTVPGVYDLYFTNGGALPPAPVPFTIVTGTPANPTTITGMSQNTMPNNILIQLILTGENLEDSTWTVTPATVPFVSGYLIENTPTSSGRFFGTLDAPFPAGVYTITLNNDLGGVSNTVSITVLDAGTPPPNLPVLTAVSPSSGAQGASVPITLTGTDLTGATVSVSGAGVTVSGVNATATQVTATLVIAAGAATGARNVTVTTPGGTSGAVTFTVNASVTPPTPGAVQPSYLPPGSVNIPMTITGIGTNFSMASVVTSNNPAVTFSAPVSATPTQLVVLVTVAP